MLYELNIIERTSEFARLFGILFNEVTRVTDTLAIPL